MKLAFQFAERNIIVHNFNVSKQLCGKNWIHGFCKRNNLTLRAPKNAAWEGIWGLIRSSVRDL
jgi:hypothetical protein